MNKNKLKTYAPQARRDFIAAVTQLFTPSWIVKYLVQNSIGRLWLMANPASTIKKYMTYYIEPAEQTLEVRAQLDALTQARMVEDGGSLNPETITVLCPVASYSRSFTAARSASFAAASVYNFAFSSESSE